jgi:CheY-like chemotaxis protein
MAILGWVRILKKLPATQTEPMLNEGVQVLEHNARNVARLIEDCLDISRITERKIHLRKQPVDLNQLLKTTIEASQNAVQNKELHFLVHLSPGSLWVSGDGTRLEQVVSNLLANAFRYTGPGGTVTVQSLASGNEAEISVEDTGIGIAPEMLEQIFQPFRQGTQHWLASESGLGLGLAIARQIVQIHGGTIWAESRGPGFGSTFRFRLPLAAERSAAPGPVAFLPQVEPIKNLQKVLFIEDSVDVLNLMRIELGELGYDVLTAKDARNGLELAHRQNPNVIVSDIKMPGMDGYEFIRQVRSTPELRSIPAIALTGFGMKRDIERALEAGYDAHVCKPVEIEHLSILIKKLISK